MNQYIKNLMTTRGWIEIEKMFEESIHKCKAEIVNEELEGDNYKTVSLANLKAARKMQALLNNIKLAGGGDQKDKISYK